MSITLKYTNQTNSYTKVFNPISVKGLDAFDEFGLYPPVKTVGLDGSRKVQMAGIYRVWTINFDIRELDDTALKYLVNFACSGFPTSYEMDQAIDFGNGYIDVVLEEPSKQASEWLNGVRFAKKISMRVEEKTLNTSSPF